MAFFKRSKPKKESTVQAAPRRTDSAPEAHAQERVLTAEGHRRRSIARLKKK